MLQLSLSRMLKQAVSQAQSFFVTQKCPQTLSNLSSTRLIATVSSVQQKDKSHPNKPESVLFPSRLSSAGLFNSVNLFQHHQLSSVPCGVSQVRHYQAVLKPRLICEGCYFAWRHGRKHVECSDHPRHKQMKRVCRRKVWREDYTRGHVVSAMELYRKIPREKARTVDRLAVRHNWLKDKLGQEL